MALQLDIKSELPTAIKWTNEHTKQLPFSIAQAMTASTKGISSIPGFKQKSALNGLAQSSKRFLDRPKPQTQTGFFATTANKRTLQVLITPKTRSGIATAICRATSSAGGVRLGLYEIAFAAQLRWADPTRLSLCAKWRSQA